MMQFFFLTVVSVFFVFGKQVEASIPIFPVPWEISFEEMNMIFYMTPERKPLQSQMDFFSISEISEERMQIRTGLYCKTSTENIYYVDISAHRNNVIFSVCGRYIATIQNTVDNFNGEKLGGGLVNFFNNGVLVKSYEAEDLITEQDNLQWTSAGIFWRYDGSRALEHEVIFNPQTNSLTIETIENSVFIFDMTTGDIISSTGPSILSHFSQNWRRYSIGAVILTILVAIFIKYNRKFHK